MKKGIWIGGAAAGLILAVLAGTLCLVDYRGKEGMQFAANLGNGINIGNSLDATGVREHRDNAQAEYYETFWNNPPIRGELFSEIRKASPNELVSFFRNSLSRLR